MPTTNWQFEFANHNGQRNYPLDHTATRKDISDTVTLPTNFLLGLSLTVPWWENSEVDRFFLRKVLLDANGARFTLAYDDDSEDPPIIAAVSVSRNTHYAYRSYRVVGVAPYDDTLGLLMVGDLSDLDSLALGDYTFDRAGGKLDVATIQTPPRGITSITVVNGNDRSDPIYGDVELVAGLNNRLSVEQIGDDPTRIIINAISGEGLDDPCDCADEGVGPCIRTINDIRPDNSGNFRLQGTDCLEISAVQNGLLLADTCAAPCCGCAELDAIRHQVERMEDGKATLDSQAAHLGSSVAQFGAVVLASRLSDQGCTTC